MRINISSRLQTDQPEGFLRRTLSRHLQHVLPELYGPPGGKPQLEGGTAFPAACRTRPTRHRHACARSDVTRVFSTPTSRLCGDAAFDVIGPQNRLFDLTALHQVEGRHERLQPVSAFSHEDHLGEITVT